MSICASGGENFPVRRADWMGWVLRVLGLVRSLKNLYIPLYPVLGGEILVSSRLGPRMESAVNMNEQAHDNMSASHGRCENGKENEKRKWQGSSVSK